MEGISQQRGLGSGQHRTPAGRGLCGPARGLCRRRPRRRQGQRCRAQVAPPTPPPRAADVAVGDEVSHVRSPSLEQTSAEAELSHSHLVSHEQGG